MNGIQALSGFRPTQGAGGIGGGDEGGGQPQGVQNRQQVQDQAALQNVFGQMNGGGCCNH